MTQQREASYQKGPKVAEAACLEGCPETLPTLHGPVLLWVLQRVSESYANMVEILGSRKYRVF